jgi:hypothetical protein
MENMKSRFPHKGTTPTGRKSPQSVTSFYEGLIIATLKDVALTCNQSDSELERDSLEIKNRFKNEGMPFLTRTLPSLGKSLDKALSSGTALDVSGFELEKTSKLPRFLGDYFKQVFSTDGLERSDASQQAVMAIRQITFLFYKLNLPFTEAQKDEVVNLFRETDEHCNNQLHLFTADTQEGNILRLARQFICRVLAGVDPLCQENILPKHGPGAVATGEKNWEKALFRRYYHRLADMYPYDKFFFYNDSHLCDDLRRFLDLEELDAGTAKVVLVPKDSRGPRLISCEPLEYQWIQQGLMKLMVKTIENHQFTRGLVNFTDQTVNGTLALQASLTGMLVTLDMKEASDRVSLGLVRALFPSRWFDALFACRSDKTKLPNGEIMYLKKFAPMGSAVCFPVEALIFWALSTAAIMYTKRSAHEGANPRDYGVYVYGDDIICNTEDHGVIMQYLPKFGLQFNLGKCCTARFFRESCGVDAYKGVIVTPLRVRSVWSSHLIGTEYLSYVALHNAAERRGFFNLCDYLAVEIQRIRRTPYTVSPTEVIALVDCRKNATQENRRMGFRMRFNSHLHRTEIFTWVARTRSKRASLPGWAEMLRVTSLSAVTPRGAVVDYRAMLANAWIDSLAPGKSLRPPPMKWEEWVDDSPVTAYLYPVPRRVTLKRGWVSINY